MSNHTLYFQPILNYILQPALNKKKLNIPVCDVLNDSEYGSIISTDFVLPQNYVRHAKKIGDEEDVTIDYNADEQDVVSSGKKVLFDTTPP